MATQWTPECLAFLRRNRKKVDVHISRRSKFYRLASDMHTHGLLEMKHYYRETAVYVITEKGRALI